MFLCFSVYINRLQTPEQRCLLFHTANEDNAYNLIHASNLTHIAEDICNALQNTIIAAQARISHEDE